MGWLRNLFGKKRSEEGQASASPRPVDEIMAPPAVTRELSAEELPPRPPLQTRPLPPPRQFESQYRRILYGTASDVGGRTNNEDASLTLLATPMMSNEPPPIGLFVVADGMGGHENGEFASATAVRILAEHVIDEVMMPMLKGREPSADQKTIPEVLADAMLAANDSVQANFPGGGTTATCAVIRGDLAYLAHVGDSRAYLVSEGHMELVTRDHLLVRRLEELGQLSHEEAEIHPQRNVLYRAIGQSEMLEVDAATRRLPPASRLLLCSDGLWGVLGDDGIMEILQECPDDPQEACERLVEAANARGGPDNITVVMVQMPD